MTAACVALIKTANFLVFPGSQPKQRKPKDLREMELYLDEAYSNSPLWWS